MSEGTVALPSDYETGLEDFKPGGATIPRLEIVHADAVFLDKSTNEEIPKLYAAPWGLILQRVHWAEKVEDDSVPLCKSNDAVTGFPNMTGASHNLFPWAKSGLRPGDQSLDEHGRVTLNCEGCPFSKWGRADGKDTPPLCSERYTIPISYGTTPDEPANRVGVVSFQRSGVTPTRRYIESFSRAKTPLFVSYVEISLTAQKRGKVVFSTPVFKRLGATPADRHNDWAEDYRLIRDMLRRPPRPPKSDDDSAPADVTPARAVVDAVVVGDPWETSTVKAEPWPATTPAAPAPAATPAASILDAVNAAPAAAATRPQPPAAAPKDDDDELPF